MTVSFDELRRLKHKLPTGSIQKLALELGIEEQTIRNYFGAKKYKDGRTVGLHIEPGPNGGIVHLNDPTIFNAARKMIPSS